MPYFYEHTNGTIIEKPDIVVDRGGGPYVYFEGPFVVKWWHESELLQPVKE
jgi:hypothetical protein